MGEEGEEGERRLLHTSGDSLALPRRCLWQPVEHMCTDGPVVAPLSLFSLTHKKRERERYLFLCRSDSIQFRIQSNRSLWCNKHERRTHWVGD